MFEPAVDPADPNHAFVLCDMTGAYVTFDGGLHWRMFNLRMVVTDFEFDTSHPDRVYAANSGLYCSEDRGSRWRLIYPDPKDVVAEHMVGDHASQWFETADSLNRYSNIDRVRVDPRNSDHIYLGLSAYRVYRDSLSVLYLEDSTHILVSGDRGASWRKLARVFGQRVLAIFPGDWQDKSEEMIVVTDRACVRISEKGGVVKNLNLPAENFVAAAGGSGGGKTVLYLLGGFKSQAGKISGGVYRSNDWGETWGNANSGLVPDRVAVEKLPFYNTIGVCESKPEVAYLSCRAYWAVNDKREGKYQYGILKTVDSGGSWQWVYHAEENTLLSANYKGAWMMRSYGPGYTGNPHGLGVSPSNPDICYATDYGRASRTVDGGATWEQLYADISPDSTYSTRGLDVTTCYGVHFDPFDKDHLFITYTDIGLFQSHNGGESWSHSLKGVPEEWINTCYWLEFDPEVKDRIWSVWGNGHDLPRLKMFRSPGFVDRFQGGVALSEDGGQTWSRITQGMPDNTDCTHILLDPKSPADSRTLYVCGTGRGVFKSTDSGKTWKTVNEGLGRDLYTWRAVLLPDGTLYLIVMRALENNRIVNGALYCSKDGAASWQKVNLPEDVTMPNDLAYDPSNPRIMYLSCWPLPGNGQERGGGVLRSIDGGLTWKRVFREDTHVYAAAVDPSNPGVVIINTFDSAAFRSDDRGETWNRLKGYNFKWGQRPVFDPHHPGMIYLTTFGGSVYYVPAKGMPGAFEDIENLNENWRWGE